MEKPRFPRLIDSTIRKTAVACQTQAKYAHFLHLRPKRPNVNLHFGGCFAAALETVRLAFYRDGLSPSDALVKGLERFIKEWADFIPADDRSPKTLANGLLSLESYFQTYQLGADEIVPLIENGKPTVEFTFSLPIPGLEHPDGGPILYGGRFDMLGSYKDSIWICDEKTTTALGDAWRTNWKLASQITGYIWASREFGYNVQGAFIRGVGVLKRDTTHLQVIETRDRWMIERWLRQLVKDVEALKKAWTEDDWSMNLDGSCSSYGGCAFSDLCLSPNPEKWFSTYDVVVWDPLAKEDAA